MRMLAALVGLCLIVLTGCEGKFAGKRGFDVTKLNRPYGMRWVEIDGNRYLGVANTNTLGDQSSGSLQFYSVSAGGFTLNEDLSLAIPNNVLDFYYNDDLGQLILLDRNESRVLVYDLDGSFVPHKDAKGKATEIALMGNPVSLAEWTRDEGLATEAPYLAILTEGSGSIQFLNRSTLQLFDLDDLNLLDRTATHTNVIQYSGSRVDQIGAGLKLLSRTNSDVIRDISSAEMEGRGTGKILPQINTFRNNALFVVASYVDDAIFGFRFYDFDNISNILFNPRTAIRGTNGIKGTKEDGFRGMDRDLSDHFYFTSRSDNRLYSIAGRVFSEARDSSSKGNTTALAQDEDGNLALDIEFGGPGINPALGTFARLGDVVVNGQGELGGNTLANRAWVLGLENNKRGSSKSRAYSVDLVSSSVSDILTFPENTVPQKLIYDPSEQLLIVAGTNANRLYLYNVAGANFVLIATRDNLSE